VERRDHEIADGHNGGGRREQRVDVGEDQRHVRDGGRERDGAARQRPRERDAQLDGGRERRFRQLERAADEREGDALYREPRTARGRGVRSLVQRQCEREGGRGRDGGG